MIIPEAKCPSDDKLSTHQEVTEQLENSNSNFWPLAELEFRHRRELNVNCMITNGLLNTIGTKDYSSSEKLMNKTNN